MRDFLDTHDALEQIQLLDTESQDRRKILLGKPMIILI